MFKLIVLTTLLSCANAYLFAKNSLTMQLKTSLSSFNQPISEKQSFSNVLKQTTTFAGITGATAFLQLTRVPSALAKASVDWDAVRSEIGKIYQSDKNKGPTMVRLAWHSSGTYDRLSKTGGSGLGTIRFKDELAHGANAGLDKAVAWLEPVYEKFQSQGLTHADLYTLAGVESIKLMNGPTIGWRAGRVDTMNPEDVTPNGRLPDADKGSPSNTAAHLRIIFGRMGFNDKEIVALSGAHALGRCNAQNSGYVGPWSPTPTTFNNLYFQLLMNLEWTPNDAAAKFQYKDPSGKLMMLPSDLVLIQDENFKKYVALYAKDQNLFFKDFAKAFQTLEELGTKNLYTV